MTIRRSALVPLFLLGILAAPPVASAEVPGAPFTSTACEGYSDSVARLYTAGLGRDPEQGGFDFWITEYTLGNWTFPAMANFFVNSPEFQRSYGTLSQDGFIRQLYRNVLGREGEAGGVQFWNGQMSAGMSRATVLMRFAESPENIERSGTVQPTLGPFNEGRLPGPWRCGPPLTGALLTLDDMPIGWVQDPTSERGPKNAGCRSSLRLPDSTDTAYFYEDPDFGPIVYHYAYVAPTPYGADRYLQQARQALVECSSYVDDGWSTTQVPLSFPRFGSDSLAIRLTSTSPDGLFDFVTNFVIVRDGSAVTVVQHGGSFFVDTFQTQDLVELAVERLASQNLSN